jgi:hypothetical protein
MAADRRTLAQQMLGLARLPITTSVGIKRGRLQWTGQIQPTPLSVTYVVRVGYAIGRRAPRVTVVHPELRAEEVESLPHVYAEDNLCLCYPWQWDDGKLISRTIVPWAAEWLLHFEIWQATGTWHGGGHEPAVADI